MVKRLGSWQEKVRRELIENGEMRHPCNVLKGGAKKWGLKYARSLRSLLTTMEESGVLTHVEARGPHGKRYLVTDLFAYDLEAQDGKEKNDPSSSGSPAAE